MQLSPSHSRGLLSSLVALGVLATAATGAAQPVVAPGRDGLPSFVRLPGATAGRPGVGISASAGYGFTEEVAGARGSHHRLAGDLALSVAPLDWLGIYARLDGRYDLHPGEDDSGAVGEPWVGTRLGGSLTPDFALGVDLALWLPGAEAPSLVVDAISFEGRLVAAYAPTDRAWQLALSAGYRLDRSAAAIDDPATLQPGDRVALGLGQTDSILLGAAFAIRPTDALALATEVRWDPWLGSGAPPVGTSPLSLGATAKLRVLRGLWAEAGVDARLSSRPDDPSGVQVPVNPRVSVFLGLRGLIGFGDDEATAEPEEEVAGSPAPGPEFTGRVLAEDGTPLAGAEVLLVREGSDAPVARTVTDANGRFELEAPAGEEGPWELLFQAEGRDPVRRPAPSSASAGAGESLQVELAETEPRGTLRVRARDFDGQPLGATVEVEDQTVETDAEGECEIDLPPGRYEVQVTAPGHQSQRRPVSIEEGGVTVLNADLRRRRGR